jgi:hypothetical protein
LPLADSQHDLLILSTLELTQGILLLHPPSRTLFAREIHMNLLLDLLDPLNCPAIQASTLRTLVCALLEAPANTRVFEQLDGLLTVTSLFQARESAGREVKAAIGLFLAFYLGEEAPGRRGRSGSVRIRAEEKRAEMTRKPAEKEELLRRYLGSGEEVGAALRAARPEGDMVV